MDNKKIHELHILYLEDDHHDAELVYAILQSDDISYDIVRTETRHDFLARLKEGTFDIILADYNLPSFDGLSALAITQKLYPDIPFIFVSGAMGEELAIETLKNGATDYVLKHHLSRLIPTIHRALDEVQKRAELRLAEEKVRNYQKHLEILVEERTTELKDANQRLEQKIRELHQTEMALRESEEKYRKLADFTYDWEFWLGPDGRYIYVSPSCERITGYDPDQFLADPHLILHIVHPEDRSMVEEHYHESIKGKVNVFHMDFRIITHQGEERWINHYCQPVFRNDGTWYGQRGSNRDITERKQSEEKLRKISNELARSNEDLKQFAYAASHDLQEPLRIIEGFTNLLAQRYKGKFDTAADDFILYIIDGVKRMQCLIRDLLEYSKVGTKSVYFEPLESSLIVERAINDLRLVIEENNAIVTYQEYLPTIKGDFTQLSRLFQNLLSNAIKFCNDKIPIVHISAEREVNEWIFSVEDNGIGIEPENRSKIFNIFHRLQSKDEYPGTGIGLALCKKIIDRHGGCIWVESEPGKGSTFYFTIPTIAR